MILLCLAGWIIILLLFPFTSSVWSFLFLMVIAGLLYGCLWSASRAYLIELAAVENLGSVLGFYAVFERCASVIGPLLWGVIMLMPLEVATRYKCAFVVMSLLVVIGGFVLYETDRTMDPTIMLWRGRLQMTYASIRRALESNHPK